MLKVGFQQSRGQASLCPYGRTGLGVEIVPGAEPGGYGVFFCTDYVQVFGFLQNFGQLGFDFGLGFAEDIFDDTLAGGGIVAGGVTAFPAAIASLADISFTVGAALCHYGSLLSSNVSRSLCSTSFT